MQTQKSERGQAVVIVIAVIILLFAVAALAIDGGIIYTDRRSAQNAADSAAISAALATVEGDGDWYTAGVNQALYNGFNNDGSSNTVQVIHPPTSGTHAGDNEYFHVIISSTSKPVFSQLIFSGTLENVVEATTRVIIPRPISMGNAIYAGAPDECSALKFSGNITVNITGGDVFSNSEADEYPSCISGVQGGASGQIVINDGIVKTVGTWSQQNGDSVVDGSGTPIDASTGEEPEPIPPVPTPICTHLSEISFKHDLVGNAMTPGIYTDIVKIPNGDYTMVPGMYCLQDGIDMTGGSLVGDGVFFYVIGGDVSISGNAYVNLKHSTNLLDNAVPKNQWAGMLFYMDINNTGILSLSGSGGSEYAGTILAPGPASPSSKTKCTISGSSAVAAGDEELKLYSQLICYSIDMTGSSNLNLIFNEADNYVLPPTLDLVE